MKRIAHLQMLKQEITSEIEHLVFLTDKIRDESELKSACLYGEISYKIAKRAFKINENLGKILERIEDNRTCKYPRNRHKQSFKILNRNFTDFSSR